MRFEAQEMNAGIAPDAVNIYTTCQTEGCANKDIPIFSAELYGTPVCGVCAADITDITDAPPELPKDMPAWDL